MYPPPERTPKATQPANVADGLDRLVVAALGIGLVENIALIAAGPASSTLLQVILLFGMPILWVGLFYRAVARYGAKGLMLLIALPLHIAPFILVAIGRTIT
jgi:hypothetical protein